MNEYLARLKAKIQEKDNDLIVIESPVAAAAFKHEFDVPSGHKIVTFRVIESIKARPAVNRLVVLGVLIVATSP